MTKYERSKVAEFYGQAVSDILRYIINAVIDIIAKQIGINPENCGFWLYAPNVDGTSPISERIENWLRRSGEKAQLKRRIQELESENAVLRSLITH